MITLIRSNLNKHDILSLASAIEWHDLLADTRARVHACWVNDTWPVSVSSPAYYICGCGTKDLGM